MEARKQSHQLHRRFCEAYLFWGVLESRNSLARDVWYFQKLLVIRTGSDAYARTVEEPAPAASGGVASMRRDDLLDELRRVWSANGAFLVEGGPDAVARAVGRRLDELGGKELMLEAHTCIRQTVSPVAAHHLEICWDGIGNWRA